MPKLLVLVQPGRQRTVPVRDQAQWEAAVCAVCQRGLAGERTVYLVDETVRCARCLRVTLLPADTACIWCGKPDVLVQDTGHAMCQPCWTIYVAYVADMVEPPGSEYNVLRAEVGDHLAEVARAREEWDQ